MPSGNEGPLCFCWPHPAVLFVRSFWGDTKYSGNLSQGTRWWVLDNSMKFMARSSCTGDRCLPQFRESRKLSADRIPWESKAGIGFWPVGWLFDWFIFKHAGQAGGRSPRLSVAVTWVIFPSSISWVCSKKQLRFEGVERNTSVLPEPLRWMCQDWSENTVSFVCSQCLIFSGADLPFQWRHLMPRYRRWRLFTGAPLFQRGS